MLCTSRGGKGEVKLPVGKGHGGRVAVSMEILLTASDVRMESEVSNAKGDRRKRTKGYWARKWVSGDGESGAMRTFRSYSACTPYREQG